MNDQELLWLEIQKVAGKSSQPKHRRMVGLRRDGEVFLHYELALSVPMLFTALMEDEVPTEKVGTQLYLAASWIRKKVEMKRGTRSNLAKIVKTVRASAPKGWLARRGV